MNILKMTLVWKCRIAPKVLSWKCNRTQLNPTNPRFLFLVPFPPQFISMFKAPIWILMEWRIFVSNKLLRTSLKSIFVIVAFIEPRISNLQANRVCDSLGFKGNFHVKVEGFSSGIWIMWQPNQSTITPILAHT